MCKSLVSNFQGMVENTSLITTRDCRVVADTMCDQNYSHRVVYNETSHIRCDVIINLSSTNLTNDEQSLVKAMSANYTLNKGPNETMLFTATPVQNIETVEEQHTPLNTKSCTYVFSNIEPEQLLIAVVPIQKLDNLLSCAQVELQENEYSLISENTSITITKTS